MPNTSPNMLLPIPVIGTDSGLVWEQSVAAAMSIIDGHDHSSGSGVPIIPSGININADLTYNDNNLTAVKSVRLQVQPAPLAGPLDLGCLYVTGDDLYFNDENGNQVQITSGGNVNATSSGISSGNASAAFISTVLTVYSDTPTTVPGDISGGSILLGLPTSSANRLTLSPPAALSGGSYSLVLPAIPVSTSLVTLDASGNLGTGQAATSNIASGAVTSSKIASGTIQQSNMAILSVTGKSFLAFSTTSLTPLPVTSTDVTITTNGGAVMGMFANFSLFESHNGGTTTLNQDAQYLIYRNGAAIYTYRYTTAVQVAGNLIYVPGGCLNFIDTPVAGTYTYQLYVQCLNAQTVVGGTAGSFGVFEI